MKCNVEGCDGNVEANVVAGFELSDDGTWSLVYMGDEDARILCDAESHDNGTLVLHKSLEAHIDEILPGTTWVGSDPRLREAT